MRIFLYSLAQLIGGLTVSTTMYFSAGPLSVSNSSFVASPNTLVADGISTSTLSLTVRDAYNNGVANSAVSLSASGGNTTFGQTTGATDSNGLFSTTVSTTTVQSETFTASFGSSNSLNANVQFTEGPASTSASALALASNPQVADGNSSISMMLTLSDAYGHPIPGKTAIFGANGSAAASPTNVTTNSSGQAVTFYTSTVAQTQNATVSVSGLSLSKAMTFVPGAAKSTYSTFTASPNSIVADNVHTAALTVRLADAYNNVISNQNVAFFSAGGARNFGTFAPATDANGIATNTLASLYLGSNILFAQTQNLTLTSTVSFTGRTAFCTGNPNYTATTIAVGSNPRNLVAGDFNADGNQDIAVTNYGGNTIGILLGTGAGHFASQVVYTVGNGPYSLDVGDFNGDGILDLAAVNYTGGTVSILLGTGAGNFAVQASTYTVGTNPSGIVVSDFDGNGKQDLAIANYNSSSVSILTGSGTGVFSAQTTYPAGTLPFSIVSGDFNRDGKQDLAVANNPNNGTVSVLMNTGAGAFASPVTLAAGGLSRGMFQGDLNGDGYQDFLVGNSNAATNFSVILGTGSGNFAAQTTYGAALPPFAVVQSDFNGDGKPDVAISASFTTLAIALNTGGGAFGLPITYPTGNTSRFVTAADFNNDGKPDMAVTNSADNTISLFLYSACN